MTRFILLTASLFLLLYTPSPAQEITLETTHGVLHGTLLIPPQPTSKQILAIIHPGSGPTDREGNQPLLKSNNLKMLAEALAAKGIASLRYDKRGIGASRMAGMEEHQLRFEHYVTDLKEWIAKMHHQYDEIVVIGHSEGALIGLLASQGNPMVTKYISIAGAAQPADQVILEQLSQNMGEEVKAMVGPYLEKVKNGDTIANVPASLMNLLRPSVQPYLTSWFQYDPSREIQALDIPILIIQGGKDLQVRQKEAQQLHRQAKESKLVLIRKMNHALKRCNTNDYKKQMAIYGDPSLPLPRKLTRSITRFILK
ncbi:MAG: alpha/beta hydrolase [Bacteroidetes bacterium]|nr:MAG: alpha/beta hydrolase [Bacteroidota bacterium]